MQLFILNRTNERQTKSVGRILLYALLFFAEFNLQMQQNSD